MEQPIYSIIIPVYRGELTITALTNRIINTFQNIINASFEIIFVYDNGPDYSWTVIKQLVSLYPNYIKGIRLSKNFGQHNAIICGIKHAAGQFIITLDEDCQYLPEDIPELIHKQKEDDFDVVYGKPKTLKHNLFRNFTSLILNCLIRLGINDINPNYSSFRIIKTEIAKKILLFNNSYSFLDGYISWITKNTAYTDVRHEKRIASKSSYSITKLVTHSINIFVTFSLLPIRLVTFFSFFIFIFTFLYTSYFLYKKIISNDLLPGFFTIVVFSGLGLGLILLALGIIGEYIYQINVKITKQPTFIEKEII